MQDGLSLFLALLVAHVSGDFLLQSAAMVQGKKDGQPMAFLRHGAIHLACALTTLLVFLPDALRSWKLYPLLGLLVVLHLAIDLSKERLADRWLPAQWMGFVLDQALHLATILLVVAFIGGEIPPWFLAAYTSLIEKPLKPLWVITIYLSVTFAGGYLIRVLLPDPPTGTGKPSAAEGDQEQEKRVGMYIGWLERFVVVTAIVAKSPTAVGLIIAAKSIVRFKKAEDEGFAEYFLLGTFLSLTLALVGGLALRWLLFGSLDLE